MVDMNFQFMQPNKTVDQRLESVHSRRRCDSVVNVRVVKRDILSRDELDGLLTGDPSDDSGNVVDLCLIVTDNLFGQFLPLGVIQDVFLDKVVLAKSQRFRNLDHVPIHLVCVRLEGQLLFVLARIVLMTVEETVARTERDPPEQRSLDWICLVRIHCGHHQIVSCFGLYRIKVRNISRRKHARKWSECWARLVLNLVLGKERPSLEDSEVSCLFAESKNLLVRGHGHEQIASV
mmetsp:Transcript_17463/g.39368  ORF Transcript_17463/g.39368 Transcript_17463/m.39368 type:complete len:234 (+) Transcript_17463:1640-2341(+)